MKKKIRWSTLSDTQIETDSNKVLIKGEPKKDLEVIIIDEEGNKISRFMDIKVNEHKVLLIPKFQWEVIDYKDTEPSYIEYVIKKTDDCWEIDKEERKIKVKPGKRIEFENAVKEIHKNLLKEKFGDDKINTTTKQEAEGVDMKYIILEDGTGGYKVNIYRGDSSEDRQFSWEQVKIEPEYGLNKQVGFENLNDVEYQEEEKKSPLTTGWIIFFVILSVIIILGIIFRKKLWRWIKGEREQEKKVKEQLDIF